MRRLFLIVLTGVMSACTTGPTLGPTPVGTPYPPNVTPASQPSELRAFYEPLLVCAGGATQVKVIAMGVASDGVLRGVPDLPVQWRTSYGSLEAIDTLSDHTDGGGQSVVLLNVPRTTTDAEIVVGLTAGSLSSAVNLRAYGQPCSGGPRPPTPVPPPATTPPPTTTPPPQNPAPGSPGTGTGGTGS